MSRNSGVGDPRVNTFSPSQTTRTSAFVFFFSFIIRSRAPSCDPVIGQTRTLANRFQRLTTILPAVVTTLHRPNRRHCSSTSLLVVCRRRDDWFRFEMRRVVSAHVLLGPRRLYAENVFGFHCRVICMRALTCSIFKQIPHQNEIPSRKCYRVLFYNPDV